MRQSLKQTSNKQGDGPDLSLDRDEQIGFVERAVKRNKNNIIFFSKSAYGISSFLEKKLTKHLVNHNTDVIYIKQQRDDDLFLNIKTAILRKKRKQSIKKALPINSRDIVDLVLAIIGIIAIIMGISVACIEYMWGTADAWLIGGATIFSTIASFLPIICIPKIIKKVSTNPKADGHYDIHSKWLSNFFKKDSKSSPNKALYLIIDDVQDVDAHIFKEWIQLFQKSGIHNFYCIYVFSDIDVNYPTNNENYCILGTKEAQKCDTSDFPAPTVDLVKLIYETFKGEKSNESYAEHILSKSGGDIYKIGFLIAEKAPVLYTPLEEKILRLLILYKNELTKDSIYKICKKSETLFVEHDAEIDQCLKKLKELNLISEDATSSLYSHKCIPLELDPKNPDNNVYSNDICKRELLSHFKEIGVDKLTRSDLNLAYDFAKDHCYADKQTYAKRILLDYLKNGGRIENKGNAERADEILKASGLSKQNEIDCYMASLYHYLHTNYHEASEWIAHVSSKDGNFIKLKALIMNRLRDLSKAEALLEECLYVENQKEKKALILAILVSVYFHSKQISKVGELYEEWAPKISGCENFGYFLRNVAWYHNDWDNLYRKAIENFVKFEDDFGRFTVLANWGNAYIESNLQMAFEKLDEAKVGLETFGEHKCSHVYNDLGISHLLKGESFETAKTFFNAAVQYSNENRLPRIFSSINLACCYVRINEPEKALKMMTDVEKEVEEHELVRVREKYYTNRLFIEFVNGNKTLESWIDKVEKYRDRYHPEDTDRLLEFYKNAPNKYTQDLFNKLYSPCNLVYWDVNPFKILDNGLLDKALTN
ncbi:MAG: hypothetical protein LBC03_03700 [Nitrososphaerota archaeon]|jgi:hypothetical protein|nr:hypothetical protein [Nitrososphaerota archaeon]